MNFIYGFGSCSLRNLNLILILCFLVVTAFSGTIRAQNLVSLSSEVVSGSAEQKRNALSSIRSLRTEAASRVAIPALSDRDEIVRSMAAAAIIFLPPDETSRLLAPLLTDRSEFVRRETIFALGEARTGIPTRNIIDVLRNDKSGLVRSAAAAALGKVGDPSAIEELVNVLRQKPRSADEYLRRAAARSIGQIAEAVRGGGPQLATPQSFLPDKYKRALTSKSATSLVPAFSTAVDVLLKTAANRQEAGDTRREAAYALGAIGDESALSFLQANIANSDNYLAEICREALLKMPMPK